MKVEYIYIYSSTYVTNSTEFGIHMTNNQGRNIEGIRRSSTPMCAGDKGGGDKNNAKTIYVWSIACWVEHWHSSCRLNIGILVERGVQGDKIVQKNWNDQETIVEIIPFPV